MSQPTPTEQWRAVATSTCAQAAARPIVTLQQWCLLCDAVEALIYLNSGHARRVANALEAKGLGAVVFKLGPNFEINDAGRAYVKEGPLR